MVDKGKQRAPNSDAHQQVLRTTLQALQRDEAIHPCVICLENISGKDEKAEAIPCGHDNFDFLCLASWVQEKNSCPLCKAVIKEIHYGQISGTPKVYHIPQEDLPNPTAPALTSSSCIPSPSNPTPSWVQQFRTSHGYSRPRKRQRQRSPPPSESEILYRRKRIYQLNLYSLHVGTNRLSGYTDLTPSRISQSPHLQSRARKWIRRELQVFDYLAPAQVSRQSQQNLSRLNAARNSEFLLEYIVAILKTVDIKGSKGQAQEMLVDFIGDKAPLFLHELNSWLRSPFEDLGVWDRNVRYEWPEGEQEFDRNNRRIGDEGFKRKRIDRWVPD